MARLLKHLDQRRHRMSKPGGMTAERSPRESFHTMLRSERGSLLPTMLLLSVVIVILVTALSRRLWQGAAFTHAITSKNAATYIAESGIQVMLGHLRRSPNDTLTQWTTFETSLMGVVPGPGGGTYQVWVSTADTGDPSLVIATALGVRGQTRQRVEALIALENPGDYFGASMGILNIAAGSIIDGKVYGTKVIFQRPTPPALTTMGTLAHYAPIPVEPTDYLRFVSTTGYVAEPRPLNFPAIDASQIAYYQGVAGTTNTWRGSDCWDKITTELGGVLQPPPTGQPIYFVQGDCVIPADTMVSGQLILVSTGDIILAGNLTKTRTGDPSSGIGLITPQNVVVQRDRDPTHSDIEVNAFVYAPQGTLYAETDVTSRGNFTFVGGYIVKSEPNIAGAFLGTRTYTYDADNRSLPLMPFRAEILQWRVRETVRS